jgi:molybdate transport system regulatory protein
MFPRYNLWIEANEEVVLSLWRVKLLMAIDESGSISAAAEKMEVPYRRAWEKIQEMERRLGFRLLDTEVGGSGGGGAILTEKAKDYVDRFRKFEEGLDEEIENRFQEAFGSILSGG